MGITRPALLNGSGALTGSASPRPMAWRYSPDRATSLPRPRSAQARSSGLTPSVQDVTDIIPEARSAGTDFALGSFDGTTSPNADQVLRIAQRETPITLRSLMQQRWFR